MSRDNVGVALFFVVVAFVLTMTILMSVFFGINRYILDKKSNIPMYVFCKSSKDIDIKNFAAKLKKTDGILRVNIISKDDAFKEMVSKFSIDEQLFDSNPFPYSLELFFEPKYTNIAFFKHFSENLKSNEVVEDVNFPVRFLKNIEDVKNKVKILSESLLSILYAVEFIVFISVISILYSHKKDDFDTLKFFGIKRGRIFSLFLKKTFVPSVFAVFTSAVLIVLIYSLYDEYGSIYYIDKELFKGSIKTTDSVR
jgi:cell division transport system permease protein